jgi:hypothetical protein
MKKEFKGSKWLFMIFPSAIIIVIFVYFKTLFHKSTSYINYINIIFDIFLLILYFFTFCYKVTIDNNRISFYTVFKRYSIDIEDMSYARFSSFMIKFKIKRTNLYILTTSKGSKQLFNMFEIYKK